MLVGYGFNAAKVREMLTRDLDACGDCRIDITSKTWKRSGRPRPHPPLGRRHARSTRRVEANRRRCLCPGLSGAPSPRICWARVPSCPWGRPSCSPHCAGVRPAIYQSNGGRATTGITLGMARPGPEGVKAPHLPEKHLRIQALDGHSLELCDRNAVASPGAPTSHA